MMNQTSQNIEKNMDKVRESQYFQDIRDLLERPAGRRFLYRLIFEICGVESISFTGNSETFFREGQRNVGVTVKSELIDQHPEAYMRMMIEMMTTRQEEILKRKAARDMPELEDES